MTKDDGDLKLDAVDRAVLNALGENARATFAEIGARVNLSASAVKRRVDRLERTGVIAGYTVVLDRGRLGPSIQAFTELRFSGNARVDSIAAIGAEIPEVEYVYTLAGDPDAVALLRVHDVADLKRVVDLLRSRDHVIGTKTLMVLGTYSNAT